MRTVTRNTLVAVAATLVVNAAALLITVHAFNRLEVYSLTSQAHSQDYELIIHNPVLYTYSFLPE